ncbi:uncharacterized protein LOC132281578 [Cornus florida]|uniref:uncharacterized protein LOC132281578 n=1 Tax=Cornus florida TaxID=4283 RepID=UPI00289EA4B6|nr:uncharacterized protein LOC132281578 [Cornus florida]
MSTILALLFQWFSLLSLISSIINVSAQLYKMPRLDHYFRGERGREFQTQAEAKIPKDFKTFFYPQTLDHFNYQPESYTTFNQKYMINSKYWGGAKKNAPIFVYLGLEEPLTGETFGYSGFLIENAPRFKALLIYIEHRFYGKSVPFGSAEKAMKNATLRGYFNSAQALADYAEVILYLKKKFSAQYSPVIVFGGSYGGMLATWFRLKYPHIAMGALASSAPILSFHSIYPQGLVGSYSSGVTKDFKDTSKSCYQTIKNSWSEIDKVASQPNGLSILSQKFKTCKPLTSSEFLKNALEGKYNNAAQYNSPPKYPVTKICNAIDGAPRGTDILGRIFAGFVAIEGKESCYKMEPDSRPDTFPKKNFPSKNNPNEPDGWRWQSCSELVDPVDNRVNDDNMLQRVDNNDISNFTEGCTKDFGVPPRPYWATTYFGGNDIRLVLKRFGSNILFSNGLQDPYSLTSVLEDISDTILTVNTDKGGHGIDLTASNPSTDPDWLVKQRQREVEAIEGWITKYFADLSSMKKK